MADVRSEEEVASWHRYFACECNNRAWQLVESTERSPADAEELLHAAHAAALHWMKIGTELNVARAHMLLGVSHGLVGSGQLAHVYATASLRFFSAHESADWEIAFAHAVMAAAARACGDPALHATHYHEAARLGAAIADAEDREIFMRTFRQIPGP